MTWQVTPETLVTLGSQMRDNVSEAAGLINQLAGLRDLCGTATWQGPAATAAYHTLDSLVNNHTKINNIHHETAETLSRCGVVADDSQQDQASALSFDPGTVSL